VSLKYKAAVITVVVAALAAVFFLTNQDPAENGEVKAGQIAVNGNGYESELASLAGDEFNATLDPYQAYNDARKAGKPIVLKFYARW